MVCYGGGRFLPGDNVIQSNFLVVDSLLKVIFKELVNVERRKPGFAIA
jgi:hypothetical protein